MDGSSPPRPEDVFDFKAPDWGPIFEARTARLQRLREQPEIRRGLEGWYSIRPVDFIRDWGMTSDPRNAEIGLPVTVPFVLFPRQAEFIQWLYDRWKGREDGMCEKSRDMGVSWLTVGFAVWMWRFHPSTVVGFGSRKEEYVDKIGDPKSLFWKAREFIRLLPVEFQPEGYDPREHAPHMRIINPENGAAIVGEAGSNIGRGNRTSIYIVDEAAFLEHQEATDAALSQTSNCKIWASTPNGAGNAFARKKMAGKLDCFTFRWQDDPRKDEAWYKKQCENLDASIVAQEIDIDYAASLQDTLIDGALIAQAQRLKAADVAAVGPWIVGIDAAHFGDDESVIHMRRGRFNMEQVVRKGFDGPALAALVEGLVKELVRFGDPLYAIVVELDGPGVSAYDSLRRGKFGDAVFGVHTGARESNDYDWNLRARMWRAARDYLKEGGALLPPCPKLSAQLSTVRYKHKDGLLLIEAKKDYKRENGCSPDRADAFALTFAAPQMGAGPASFEPDFDSFE